MTAEDLKSMLELMQVQRFEASLAELNSTLVDILLKQTERDMSSLVGPLTEALVAAFKQMPQLAAPVVTVPVTVQPAQVVIPPEPPENEGGGFDIEFKRNSPDGRISGMKVMRLQ